MIVGIVEQLDIYGDVVRVGMTCFSTSCGVDWYLDEYIGDKTGLINAIKALTFLGGTTNPYCSLVVSL